MLNRKFVSSEVERLVKGLCKPKEADAQLLPSPDVPVALVKRQHKEDPLKACVRNLLDQGGRSEEEATAWCRDYLAMKPDTDEATATDSANIREAERTMVGWFRKKHKIVL